MGNILAYSAITAKTRAMSASLFSVKDFKALSELENVSSAVIYLKQHPGYRDVFKDAEETALHRRDIERLLKLSMFQDFTKLYRFANGAQRRFLNIHFMYYEVVILKNCLRTVFDHRKPNPDLFKFKAFFEQHSHVDLTKLSASQSLEDFVINLKGSMYYETLSSLNNSSSSALYDYELALDIFYFKCIWKLKSKYLPKQEDETLTKSFGPRMDLLNIQWIYRSKKFFQLTPEKIYSMIIPINYKLKQSQLKALVEAPEIGDFQNILNTTYYSRTYKELPLEADNLDAYYQSYLSSINAKESRRNPYSVAVLNSYFYHKGQESRKIITIIEGIRYGLEPRQIISYISSKDMEVNIQ